MNDFDLTTLKVGDACGINEPTSSFARRARVVAATVVKTTKTTVTVCRNHAPEKTYTFNVSNGLERGSNSSCYRTDRLVSAETLEHNQNLAKMDAAVGQRARRREDVLNRMLKASENDANFAALLLELNQREYAL